ncbi:MAG: c-type cytochrome biogenesis protein CcsB [Desulfamplus sp.]|nr:c-type cytochrome biogenesis protein CcsB [Desulfamplus sp.]MBF0411690.1 c-type cytochrome biogenesis protein CcsB [Desulfamplus sp.]
MAVYISYLFRQKEEFQNYGFFLICAGALLHFGGICVTTIIMGTLPAYNLQQTLYIAALALSGTFIVLNQKFNLKILGLFASPLVVIMMIAAFMSPDTPPLKASFLKGFWLVSHIVTIFTGEAALALACGAGILYLIQEKAIKEKRRGFFYKRLPSLALLDSTSYTSVITGFTMLTTGLITGLIYAKSVWGTFWSWDPKEIWSAVTWLVYAALLHGRLTSGWRGRKSAIMTIVGFAVLLFTLFGVNLLIGGHHQPFTK